MWLHFLLVQILAEASQSHQSADKFAALLATGFWTAMFDSLARTE